MTSKKRTVKEWNALISETKASYEVKILNIKNEFNDRLNAKDDKIESLQREFDYQLEIALRGINESLFAKKLELKERDDFIEKLIKTFKGIDDVTKLIGRE